MLLVLMWAVYGLFGLRKKRVKNYVYYSSVKEYLSSFEQVVGIVNIISLRSLCFKWF